MRSSSRYFRGSARKHLRTVIVPYVHHKLPAAIEYSEVSLYADDTVLEPRELESKLNADLYNV